MYHISLLYYRSLLRQQRLAEWKAKQLRNVFGEMKEISGQDYIQEVNKAGDGIWVVLHLYKQGCVSVCVSRQGTVCMFVIVKI